MRTPSLADRYLVRPKLVSGLNDTLLAILLDGLLDANADLELVRVRVRILRLAELLDLS